MLTKSKIILASTLLLGSVSLAHAEDPEANLYHLQSPAVTSHDSEAVPFASTGSQQIHWRKLMNNDSN